MVDHTERTSSGRNPTLVARWCAPVMEPQASNVKLNLKVSERETHVKCRQNLLRNLKCEISEKWPMRISEYQVQKWIAHSGHNIDKTYAENENIPQSI